MNRQEFILLLKASGIDPEIIAFDSSTHEGYNIRKNDYRWEAFFRERGKEYDCIGFPSESDALKHILEKLNIHFDLELEAAMHEENVL